MKRVLILGDSISIGYTPVVTELLSTRAVVERNPGNAAYSTNGLRNLPAWLSGGPWDVIHFNWGIWDLHRLAPGADPLADSISQFDRNGIRRTTAAQYESNLRQILALLKPAGCRLIWATITPQPESKVIVVLKGDEVEYNQVSTRLMREQGVAINDLYGHMLPRLGEFQPPDDVHFTTEGSRFLGEKVAAAIGAELDAM